MPRIVNYADRVEAIREAVYEITLRDGVEGISLAAVAREVFMPARTVQRLVSSADVLPLLGLQWAEKLARFRFINRRKAPAHGAPTTKALHALLGCLPGDPDKVEEHVWWTLVVSFEPTCDWAWEAWVERDATLSLRSAQVIETLAVDDPTYESRRLHLLTTGAITEIVHGRATYEEVAELVTEHVGRLARPVEQEATPGGGATAA